MKNLKKYLMVILIIQFVFTLGILKVNADGEVATLTSAHFSTETYSGTPTHDSSGNTRYEIAELIGTYQGVTWNFYCLNRGMKTPAKGTVYTSYQAIKGGTLCELTGDYFSDQRKIWDSGGYDGLMAQNETPCSQDTTYCGSTAENTQCTTSGTQVSISINPSGQNQEMEYNEEGKYYTSQPISVSFSGTSSYSIGLSGSMTSIAYVVDASGNRITGATTANQLFVRVNEEDVTGIGDVRISVNVSGTVYSDCSYRVPSLVIFSDGGDSQNIGVLGCERFERSGNQQVSDSDATSLKITTGRIVVTKQGNANGVKLAGAVYELYKGDTKRTECTTGADGTCTFSDLPPAGDYRVHEITPPTGYALTAEDQTVRVYPGRDTPVLMKDIQLVNLKIYKYDETNKEIAIPGAKFMLYNSDCTTLATYYGGGAIGEVTTGADGSVTINGLMPGTYCIKETATIDDYKITEAAKNGITVTISESTTAVATTALKEISNIPLGKIHIIKIDEDTDRRLAGVEFELYKCTNVSDKTCTEKITEDAFGTKLGENGTLITDAVGEINLRYLYYGRYQLVETKNPEKYEIISQRIDILIDTTTVTNGVIHTAENTTTVKNTPIKVKILKKNFHDGNPLAGATITVSDVNNNTVYKEFITTTDEFELMFVPGDYVINESIAPEGFQVNSNLIYLHIDQDGKITITNDESEKVKVEDQTIIIYDEKNKIIISKKDITTGDELPGAEIEIKTLDGELAKDTITEEELKFTSTTEPKEYYLEEGEYTLKETVAPQPDATCLSNLQPDDDPAKCNYEVVENELQFKILPDGNIQVLGDDNQYYYVEANRVTIYNGTQRVEVPDTGAFVSIVTIAVGGAIVYFGYQVLKRKQQQY